MSHFPVVVTLPDFMDSVYGSEDLSRDHLKTHVTEKLRPFKEVGWGSDVMPEKEDLKWRVYENHPSPSEEGPSYDERVYDTLEELNATESDLPEVTEPGTFGEIEKDDGSTRDRFEVYVFNPNAKWDWWVIGGRFPGQFRVRDPREDEFAPLLSNREYSERPAIGDSVSASNEVDVAQRKYVDFKGKMKDGAEQALAIVDALEPLLEKHPEPKPISHFRDLAEDGEIPPDEVGERYHEQPGMDAFKDAIADAKYGGERPLLMRIDEVFNLIRHGADKFVTLKSRECILPFAICHDGEWLSQSEMGWFGVRYDEGDWEEWVMKGSELLLDLDPEAVLVNVDCHI